MGSTSSVAFSAWRLSNQSAVRSGFLVAGNQSVFQQQQRTAVSLKELKNRMGTVKAIQKITSSMNKLATSRLTAARKKLENLARPFLAINMGFLKDKGMEEVYADSNPEIKGKELLIIISTDRGMCGATNSNIIRNVRSIVLDNRKSSEFTIAIAGAKAVVGLRRDFGQMFHTNVQELGKKHLSFVDVEPVVDVLDEVTDYDVLRIISNQWESVVASKIIHRLLPNPRNMVDAMKDAYYGYEYDGTDEDELFKNLQEQLAARMNSMDNASTNAKGMHARLNLLYNRTRQSNITTELSEIISGAASVQEQLGD